VVTLSGRLFGLGAGVKDTCCSKKELHHRIGWAPDFIVLRGYSSWRSTRQTVVSSKNPMTRLFPQIGGRNAWAVTRSDIYPVEMHGS